MEDVFGDLTVGDVVRDGRVRALGTIIVLAIIYFSLGWLGRVFRRHKPTRSLPYVGAWGDVLKSGSRWTESVASGRLPAGHATLDVKSGRSVTYRTNGSDDIVTVTMPDGDEATFRFWNGFLIVIECDDESFDDTTREFRSAQRRAREYLAGTRTACGYDPHDPEAEPPKRGDTVERDRDSVMGRRKRVMKKRAKLGGPKIPKEFRDADDEKPRKKK